MTKKLVLFIVLSLSLVGFGSFRPIAAEVSVAVPKTTQVLICNSSSSYAYHSYKCSGLSRCTHGISKISLAEAQEMGRKACKICYR